VDSLVHENAEIVIVDDEPSVVRFLSRALQSAGYKAPQGFSDPLEACSYLEVADPDLITLDICMPGLDGYGVLDALGKKRSPDTFLPVLAISALDDFDSRQKAIKAGAKDFLVKPVAVNEFLLHVYALLDTRFLERRLKETYHVLENSARESISELGRAHVEIIERLARVAELRDDATGKHIYRVARLSALLAQELDLAPQEVELIMRAAPLHDVGKVAIEDKVLKKEGRFSPEEREVMRQHALLGAQLLSGGRSDLMKTAEQIAVCHHERWDGHGYPHGLAGEEIPLAARIVAVADAFDALTHERSYKEAWSVRESMAEMERERGAQFDPHVVDALQRLPHTLRDLVTGLEQSAVRSTTAGRRRSA
jgi:putative two-component system response regulator